MTDTPKCFSCKADAPWGEVEYIASAPHKDGEGKIAFGAPLCHAHRPFAMVCGWFPIHEFNSTEGQKLWTENGYGNKDKLHPLPSHPFQSQPIEESRDEALANNPGRE